LRRGLLAVFLCLAAALLPACTGELSHNEEGPKAALPVPPSVPAFDPDSSWSYLVQQVEFGPRVPGDEAHRRCGDWLVATLLRLGGDVEEQEFVYLDPEGTEWPLRNVLGRFGPEGGSRLLLVAHWDSRPWADQDPDPSRHNEPVLGANDGASGVAVLLEVARHLGQETPPQGVDILFTDGEDLGTDRNQAGYCRGSLQFAQQGLDAYREAIVLDLVGGTGLQLPMEYYSVSQAPELFEKVWARGRLLSPEIFTETPGSGILDDHVPLLKAGLPAVDLIDISYPAWHTTRDDLSGVSPLSLEGVGRVMLSLVYNP
jgi:hypothetical protein